MNYQIVISGSKFQLTYKGMRVGFYNTYAKAEAVAKELGL